MTIRKLSSSQLEYILTWNTIKVQSPSQCREVDGMKGRDNTKYENFTRNKQHEKEWSCLYWFFCATVFFLYLPVPIKINNYFQGEREKKKKKRKHIRSSLKGNEHFQIWNSSFLCILREKYTGFALSCKYTTWFSVIILKWQLMTTPSQNKLLFNSHCTTCGVFLPQKNQEKLIHFIDKSV